MTLSKIEFKETNTDFLSNAVKVNLAGGFSVFSILTQLTQKQYCSIKKCPMRLKK